MSICEYELTLLEDKISEIDIFEEWTVEFGFTCDVLLLEVRSGAVNRRAKVGLNELLLLFDFVVGD